MHDLMLKLVDIGVIPTALVPIKQMIIAYRSRA
jgi:hypothetical protein